MKKILGFMLIGMLGATTAIAGGVKYDNGVVVSDEKGDNVFKVNGRGKTRLDWQSGGDFKLGLDFPEMRLMLHGHFFGGKLGYFTQLDFASWNKENGWDSGLLKDYFFNYNAAKDVFQVRFGQFKPGLYRGYMTSSGKLALADRAFFLGSDYRTGAADKDNAFAMGRRAISFHNRANDTFAYNVDVGGDHFGVRLAYNSDKMRGYDEWDSQGGDFRFSVAGAAYLAMSNFLGADATKTGFTLGTQNYGIDAAFKLSGLALLIGGYLENPSAKKDGTLAMNGAWYAQASYMATDWLGVALRYAGDAVTDRENGSFGTDIAGGVTFFCPKTSARTFLNVGAGNVGADGSMSDAWNFRVALMTQLSF